MGLRSVGSVLHGADEVERMQQSMPRSRAPSSFYTIGSNTQTSKPMLSLETMVEDVNCISLKF